MKYPSVTRVGVLAVALLALSACASNTPAREGEASDHEHHYQDDPSVIVGPDGKRSFPLELWKDYERLAWERVEYEAKQVGAQVPDKPDVHFVSYATGNADIIACLHEQGVTQAYDDNGIITYEATKDQSVAVVLADYVCSITHPRKPSAPLDEDRISRLWHWQQEHTRPCYEKAGYDPPPLASHDAYVDRWFAEKHYDLTGWLLDLPYPENVEMAERCPDVPEDLFAEVDYPDMPR